ncbi:MAG: Lhr family helicase, partial [Candidatus Nanopelagicales bacterium]
QPDRGGSAGSPGQPEPADPLHVRIVDLLGRRGARFLREIAAELSAESLVPEVDVAKALDSLAWQGLVTNDTWEPMRRGAPRTPVRPLRRRSRRSGITRPTSAPTGGRWSLTPASTMSATARHLAVIETLLDRYGIVTREAVSAAGFPGGFAAAYRILTAMEEAGRCRRVYALEGQGAAQFALPGAIDQLRSLPTGDHAHRTLAAADPAQPYGALLSWPEAATRPARTAGAWVTLTHDGPALYLARGRKSLTTWPVEDLHAAAQSLASALAGQTTTITRIDGEDVGALAADDKRIGALIDAGFAATPSGLRLRR